jgi:beta-lactamase regulating signal transducer with metallopeptidase domain
VSGWLGTLEFVALVGIGAALLSVAACALLFPLLRGAMRRLAPERRARLLSTLAAAPLALPAVLVVLCLLPSVLAAVGLHRDHCPHHAEHLHLCVTHRPPELPLPWSVFSLLGVAPVVGALAVGAAGASRARRLRRSLELGPEAALQGDVRLVASPLALCVTAGALRPVIFVSERFAAELPAGQLEAVIEHERAHARRRDGLRKLAAAALSWMHPPALRRRLLGDLSLACEQACDAEAARSIGDRLRVAEAILGAERLLGRCGESRAVCAFGGSQVPERVERLLDEDPAPRVRGRAEWAWLAAAAAAALALADPLHHLAEHVLARLLL